jgi:hypothetical protein
VWNIDGKSMKNMSGCLTKDDLNSFHPIDVKGFFHSQNINIGTNLEN